MSDIISMNALMDNLFPVIGTLVTICSVILVGMRASFSIGKQTQVLDNCNDVLAEFRAEQKKHNETIYKDLGEIKTAQARSTEKINAIDARVFKIENIANTNYGNKS